MQILIARYTLQKSYLQWAKELVKDLDLDFAAVKFVSTHDKELVAGSLSPMVPNAEYVTLDFKLTRDTRQIYGEWNGNW